MKLALYLDEEGQQPIAPLTQPGKELFFLHSSTVGINIIISFTQVTMTICGLMVKSILLLDFDTLLMQ